MKTNPRLHKLASKADKSMSEWFKNRRRGYQHEVEVEYSPTGKFGFDFCFLLDNKQRSNNIINYFNRLNFDGIRFSRLNGYIGKYKSPVNYESWDWVTSFMSNLINKTRVKELGKGLLESIEEDRDLDAINESTVFSTLAICSNLQPIYLTNDIVLDLLNTDFKGFDIVPPDILPAYTFMLPKGQLNAQIKRKHSETIDSFNTIIVITNKEYYENLQNAFCSEVDESKDQRFVNYFRKLKIRHANKDKSDLSNSIFSNGFKMIALSDKAAWCIGDFNWKNSTTGIGKATDNDVTRCLLNIAINSILLMSHKPEYITQQSPLLGGRGFSDTNLPQPAKWLGENYESQNTRYEYPPDYVPSKGKSPRSHWRRGHMRHVCQGKGRKQRTLTWIKPVFVTGRGVAA